MVKITKKAALNLGISTVVVLVIAMVVIGAGISFIRTFFDLGTESLEGAFLTDQSWGNLADRNNPLVLARTTIDIGQRSGDTADVEVRFYNRNSYAVDVTLNETLTCTGSTSDTRLILNLTTLDATNIQPSSMTSIPSIVRNPGPHTTSDDMDAPNYAGLGQGTHICELIAHVKQTGHHDNMVNMSLQARVNVAS